MIEKSESGKSFVARCDKCLVELSFGHKSKAKIKMKIKKMGWKNFHKKLYCSDCCAIENPSDYLKGLYETRVYLKSKSMDTAKELKKIKREINIELSRIFGIDKQELT